MANILLDKDLSVRTTKISDCQIYELTDITFCVHNTFNSYDIYISLVDKNGMTEILPLTFFNTSGEYKVYKVNPEKKIRTTSGLVNIRLLLNDKKSVEDLILSSGCIPVHVSIQQYALTHQLYICNEVNQEILNRYEKIVQLTDMNVKIHSEISELQSEIKKDLKEGVDS